MAKEERIIEDRLQELFAGMNELGYKAFQIDRLKKLVDELEQVGIYGLARFVNKLIEIIKDKNQYFDVEKEGRFAILLANSGFLGVTFIKRDLKIRRPDIKATYDGDDVYFEVTRKRYKVDEWAVEPENVQWPSDDIISKMQDKLGQLVEGEINVLVFWSSTMAVDKHRMAEAFEEIRQNPGAYRKLSGILFTEEEGFSIPSMKQYYLFKNENASKLIDTNLAEKLESLSTLSPKELEERKKRWGSLLKRRKY